ncbi:23S rRNA (cytidine(2498)-2'-O)-methyltransferase RlmM [Luteimonas granuli]|uniref:Ribosomal RNA large subunit methyltransferase M n=1 Tax=Luteimonas granuli TaxID=1176533 RepID=A0A518N5Q1_9GAMM|nr:23S rRNA (cytidine(2498)-2'-O)-methyltransferase RlmM [Luteimonas granuli]QDW67249.1 23S rRNA (cytidine(2498)-2'-O)-methyltransferase RlmM [Luteimonas granuli]
MSGLLCYCRAGFEPELAAELGERAAEAGHHGYAAAGRGSGFVRFLVPDGDAAALSRALPWRQLVFARQKLVLLAELQGIDTGDRIAPLLAALRAHRAEDRPAGPAFGALMVEHPDSDEARPLAGLARALGNAARPALRKAGLLSATDDARRPRLHVCLLAGDHMLLAVADTRDASPWSMGVPRLRLHRDAPSRSALKLEEAFLTLLDDEERTRLLRPGMAAADLGAAPGGWTWVLQRAGLHVTAVDNGPLREHVLLAGGVEHLRADGFHWQPARPLEWMVCDMVEQPRRVASRMATWFREGWCRQAVFNLKLPMKKRWMETALCLDVFRREAQRPLELRARQLYHDREEITVLAMPAGG